MLAIKGSVRILNVAGGFVAGRKTLFSLCLLLI